MSAHSAMVKIGIEDEMATVIIACLECGGQIEFEIPAVHLATLANACSLAAKDLGIKSVSEQVASFKTGDRTEASCDAVLNELRRKAHLN